MAACPDDGDLVREEISIQELLDHWLANVKHIKETIALGTDHLNLAMIGTFALAEAISFNLFKRSPRYYFGHVLRVEHSNLMYEAFRNGFTHSYHPNRLFYQGDVCVNWAWSSDTSPSGFRSFDFGGKDPETGEVWFKPDEIVDFVQFGDDEYQISISLDRLVGRIEADLNERKANAKPTEKIRRVVGKRFDADIPKGAKDIRTKAKR